MNGRNLKWHFNRFKQLNNLDFADTTVDKYGDCRTCVGCGIEDKFGDNAMGIYAQHWNYGINKGKSYKDMEKVYVCHWLNEDLGAKFIEYFSNNGYNVEPKIYDDNKSFVLSEIKE